MSNKSAEIAIDTIRKMMEEEELIRLCHRCGISSKQCNRKFYYMGTCLANLKLLCSICYERSHYDRQE